MCPGQVCSARLGFCVDCEADVDCPGEQVCRGSVCVAPPRVCRSSRECSDAGLVCDTARSQCVECVSDADCSAGRRCGSGAVCFTPSPDMRDAGEDGAAPDRAQSDAPLHDRVASDSGANDAVVAPTDIPTVCPSGRVLCNMACVDLTGSNENCGACGTTCAAGTVCVSGRCAAMPSAPAPALSQARESFACVVLADGRVLAAGGYTSDSLNSTEIYDPSSNRWTAGPSLPNRISAAAAVRARDGRVYLFGGHPSSGTLNTTYVLDAAASSWRALAPMPTSRLGACAAVANDGRIYVMGGLISSTGPSTTTNVVEVYDPATDRWGTAAPMATARVYSGVATLADGRIAVFGGGNIGGTGAPSSVEFYDPVTNRWTDGPPLPAGLSGVGSHAASDGLVHLVGGYSSSGYVATHYAFNPVTGTYRTLAMLPSARYNLGLVEAPTGRLLAIGGRTAGAVTTVSSYSIATDTWR